MSQVNNLVNNFTTGFYILDCMIISFVIIVSLTIDFTIIKDNTTNKINYMIKTNKHNMIILSKTNELQSDNFKAIMYYASKLNNKSIHCLHEYFLTGWDNNDNNVQKENGYIIDQINDFILDDDIYGILSQEHKEKSREQNRTEYTKITLLKIYSKNKSLVKLQEWINNRLCEYNTYLRYKSASCQLLINVTGDEHNEINIEGIPWDSTITFENSYFADMDNIIEKINFFLNNKKYYIKHGIPYNLGILLYGIPGCGKTRFIKQLMNHTKRHGIDIKLNDMIDFAKLKNIIYKENIGENYIIPQEKRIIIFEDIDCMGAIVKDRDITNINKIEDSNDDLLESLIELSLNKDEKNKKEKKHLSSKNKKEKNNNNLSYLLNIIDGLNECSGRIIIMTTNKIDILDKALIRPGRIDLKIEFKKCTVHDIYKMLQMFWEDKMKTIDKCVLSEDIDEKYTSAEIINIFRSTDNFNDIINKFIK